MATNSFIGLSVLEKLNLLGNPSSQLSPEQRTEVLDSLSESDWLLLMLRVLGGRIPLTTLIDRKSNFELFFSQLTPEQCTKGLDRLIEIGDSDDILRFLWFFLSQLDPEQRTKAMNRWIEIGGPQAHEILQLVIDKSPNILEIVGALPSSIKP
jgi:hypothetical protein